jgi:hypothetical protein
MELTQNINDNSNYFLNISGLNDVLIFYKDYYFESKIEEITIIEDIIRNENSNYYIYLRDFEIAKEMNKRTHIIKYLYTSKNGGIITENQINIAVKNWERLEKMIRNKNISEIDKNDNIILNEYFNNDNNEKLLLKIFNKDAIIFFRENNNYILSIIYKLKEILLFYKDYKFETKKNDIILIEEIIKNKKGNYEKYLKDYDIAKFFNLRNPIINKLYNYKYKDAIKKEKNYNIYGDLWKHIEGDIRNRNIENIGSEDSYILNEYFNDKNNELLLLKIFNEESINFFKVNNIYNLNLMKLKEILTYYKEYLFESKEKDII